MRLHDQLLGTTHHTAFDRWWDHAKDNYVRWAGDDAVGIDLYYDPVVDEHVGTGPIGLIAPAWYLAPQRREVAEAGWRFGALLSGALGDGPVAGLDNPQLGVMLAQLAGEFADEATKARIWAAADEHFEPTWDVDAGEFTLGFGLGEDHPRGQWNARAMAGWICTPGAWSAVFNQPNLAKFDEPTVVGVDFPRVALAEASWSDGALVLAAVPQRPSGRDDRTTVRVTNLGSRGAAGWTAATADGRVTALGADGGGDLVVELTCDGRPVTVSAPAPPG